MNCKTKLRPLPSSAETGIASGGVLALYRGMWGIASILAPLMLRGTKHLSQQEMKDELEKMKEQISNIL